MRALLPRLLLPAATVLATAVWSSSTGLAAAAAPAAPTPQVFRFDSGGGDNAYAQVVDGAGNSYLAGSVQTAGTPITFAVVKLGPQGNLVWRHTYSGSRGGTLGSARAVAVDAAGNVYAAGGISDSANPFEQDFLVLKLGPDGQERWAQRSTGGGGLDFATRIAVDQAGEVSVGGQSMGAGFDWLTQRYGPDGTLRWARRFSGPGAGDDVLVDMALAPNGDLAVTGEAKLTGDGVTNDIETLEYGPQGDVVWQRQFTDTAISDDVPADLDVDAAGNVVVTGVTARNASPENTVMGPVTVRYDAAGTLVRTLRAGGGAVHIDRTGNVYLAGSIDQSAGNSTVAEFTAAGAQVWSTPLPLAAGDMLTVVGVAVDPAGNVTVAGTVNNQSTLNRDYLTLRYSPAGQERWRQRFDGPGPLDDDDQVAGLALDGTGAALVAGTSNGASLSARQDIVELRFP